MLLKHSSKQKTPRTVGSRHSDHANVRDLEDLKLLSVENQKITTDRGETSEVRSYRDHNEESHVLAHRYDIPEQGMDKLTAYELIHNELTLDGNPHLNLASFVNTFTTHESKKLITENLTKNLADNDEYPQLIEIMQRCISMLAQLWRCSDDLEPLGCATTGSSEAIMLGGLAMKKKWLHKMQDAGRQDVSKPNIIMSSACQVALEKFARYFDVECREVPVSAKTHHSIDPNLLWDYVDENTIGVFVILGTTYTGHLESIEAVSDVLAEIENQHPDWANKEIPIHVDGASGGFVVPFAFGDKQLEKVGLGRWGFDHPRVVSINTSGHKFGLVTPGLGWVLWRDENYLSPELRFRLKYLGGVEETFGLNFSRPGFQVVHQYYNFMWLGYKGYKRIFDKSLFVARVLSHELMNSPKLQGHFEIISSIHERIDNNKPAKNVTEYWDKTSEFKPGVPLVAFRLSDKFRKDHPEVPQALVSKLLRSRGWIIPNYPLPKSTDGSCKWEVLRVVCRYEMKLNLAQALVKDLEGVITKLIGSYDSIIKAMDSVDEKPCEYIYKMLLAIASPDEDEDEDEESSKDQESAKGAQQKKKEKQEYLRERTSRNYRGTC